MDEVDDFDTDRCFPDDDEMPTFSEVAKAFRTAPALHKNIAGFRMGQLATGQPSDAIKELILVRFRPGGAPSSDRVFQNVAERSLGRRREYDSLHALRRSLAWANARSNTSSTVPSAYSPRSS